MKQEAPWDILKISQGATLQEIEIARRTLAAKYHPDKASNTTPEIREMAAERTKQINAAADEMVRTIRARTNASRANQSPPPQDEKHPPGAKRTTYHPGASKPFLQILGMIALLGLVLLGFFHHLYLPDPRFRSQPAASPTPGTISANRSQPTSSPSPSPPQPDAQILKQPCGVDVEFELTQARLEGRSLIIPIIVRGPEQRRLELDLERAVVTGEKGETFKPSRMQDPDGNEITSASTYKRAAPGAPARVELVCVISQDAPIPKSTKLRAFDLPLAAGCVPLHFQNIPIYEPTVSTAKIFSAKSEYALFKLGKARMNPDDNSLVIPLAVTYVGQAANQYMMLDFQHSTVTVAGGENGHTFKPSRLQHPGGKEITDDYLTYQRGEQKTFELVFTSSQNATSVLNPKKVKAFDLEVVGGNFVDEQVHFQNISVNNTHSLEDPGDFYTGYYKALKAQNAQKKPAPQHKPPNEEP